MQTHDHQRFDAGTEWRLAQMREFYRRTAYEIKALIIVAIVAMPYIAYMAWSNFPHWVLPK